MEKEKIILVGGGGHAKSVIDIIERGNHFTIAGIIDIEVKIGTSVFNYPVIASDGQIDELCAQYKNFIITVGQIRSAEMRMELFSKFKSKGANFPVIASPNAYISKHALVSEGVMIMHNAFINAGVTIGQNCIINTGAIIEHDAQVGDHCHISTGALLNGGCRVYRESFIGSGSIILNDVIVHEKNVIAAGAVVTDETSPQALYAGNPAVFKKFYA